ncbi:MAG: Unknown protein [uncultured Thiotrichaceae bacterium]|uniref:Uncharacterized protein n=1 Tax=uncultured Thiotrichaceae bacterium TaxID=298394 RepID=A0A6S6TBN5_9GAMM|nr:MAG: Unknown protein [uncultured Thiotrichaceae bacterium]
MSEKSDLHREYVLELENELRELEKREESSTKRMQLLVYPAMVAFIVLAAYGFFLVQSLTSDVDRMANSIIIISDSVEKNMTQISQNTISMSDNMSSLDSNIHSMTDKMIELVESTGSMSSNVGSMSQNIGVMRDATANMANSTNNMQQDMWSLNQNVSTPLSMFNKFMPFSNNSMGRFPGSSGRVQRPVYYYQPQPVQTMPITTTASQPALSQPVATEVANTANSIQ